MKLELTIEDLQDPESFLAKQVTRLMLENKELKAKLEFYEARMVEAMGTLNSAVGLYDEEEEIEE